MSNFLLKVRKYAAIVSYAAQSYAVSDEGTIEVAEPTGGLDEQGAVNVRLFDLPPEDYDSVTVYDMPGMQELETIETPATRLPLDNPVRDRERATSDELEPPKELVRKPVVMPDPVPVDADARAQADSETSTGREPQ